MSSHENPTAITIRLVMEEAAARERARCLGAILNWPGLSEDEKRIAVAAIMDAVGDRESLATRKANA